MKTYKQLLLKKWWRGNFIVGVAFFSLVLLLVLSGNIGYTVFLIPIVFVSSLLGGLKCPTCKKRLNIPSGPRGFDGVNHCGGCGFDLNQVAPKNYSKKEAEPQKADGLAP